jgi:thioredoxin-related protein
VNSLLEDIFVYIALPLIVVPQSIHDKFETDPQEYIGYLEEVVNQKKKVSSVLGNAIKLIESLVMKIDGTLKQITTISIALLENCIDPSYVDNLNAKLLNSLFFKATSSARFESLLLLLTSLSYLTSSRKDILKDIEGFVIKHEIQLLNIKDKTIILMFEVFYSYYAELFWKSKDLKDHLWSFYSYFLLLSKINGPENRVLRLQAFDTLQAIIEQNNFRSFFLQDIPNIIDQIVNNESD